MSPIGYETSFTHQNQIQNSLRSYFQDDSPSSLGHPASARQAETSQVLLNSASNNLQLLGLDFGDPIPHSPTDPKTELEGLQTALNNLDPNAPGYSSQFAQMSMKAQDLEKQIQESAPQSAPSGLDLSTLIGALNDALKEATDAQNRADPSNSQYPSLELRVQELQQELQLAQGVQAGPGGNSPATPTRSDIDAALSQVSHALPLYFDSTQPTGSDPLSNFNSQVGGLNDQLQSAMNDLQNLDPKDPKYLQESTQDALKIQQLQQQIQEIVTLMSNMLKFQHDTDMTILNNTKM